MDEIALFGAEKLWREKVIFWEGQVKSSPESQEHRLCLEACQRELAKVLMLSGRAHESVEKKGDWHLSFQS
jgi:hypothetical protein